MMRPYGTYKGLMNLIGQPHHWSSVRKYADGTGREGIWALQIGCTRYTLAKFQRSAIEVAAAFSEKRCIAQKFLERALEFEESGRRHLEECEIL